MKGKHFLIAGSDEFMVKARAETLMKSLAPEDTMNLEIINGYVDSVDDAKRQLAAVIESLQTLPFFASSKLVFFKDVNFLGDGVIARSEGVLELLENMTSLLKKIPSESAQFIMSAGSVDKRRVFFKAFSEFGAVEFFDRIDITRERNLDIWLEEVDKRVKAAGLKPAPMVIERLVELAGNDSRALNEEIEKLRLYSHPEGKIDEAAVKAVCSSSREMVIWDLCDAMTFGKTSVAVELLKKLLAQGESEVGILIVISGNIRLAAIGCHLKETKRLHLSTRGNFVTTDLSGDAEELLPRNKQGEKPSLFRLGKIVQQAGKRSSACWYRGIEILHNAHAQLFVTGADRPKILESAVMQLCMLHD